METNETEKIPLEAIVKWLNGKLTKTRQELNHANQVNGNLRKELELKTKELQKLTTENTKLTAEVAALRKDSKKSEWYKEIHNSFVALATANKDLKRRYNSVLSELARTREKYGE